MSRLIKHNISLRNVSLCHSNGSIQFSHLSFSLPQGLCGLVGDNGTGKSLLAKIIVGELLPSSGSVEIVGPVYYLGQDIHLPLASSETLADHFGVSTKLSALANIEQGSIAEEDYQIIGDDWLFAEHFHAQLLRISKRLSASSKLISLSGGELRMIMLRALFFKCEQDNGTLILDEPSNHLDSKSKAWLAEQLMRFEGKCLLISHDRSLLNICQYIAKLSVDGISLHEGNYDAFDEQQIQHEQARVNRLYQLQAQKKQALASAQRDTEKAQKRASQGHKKGQQGGMPKVLLGAKKNKAELSSGAKIAQHKAKLNHIKKSLQHIQTVSVAKSIQFHFVTQHHKSKRLLYIDSLVLEYVVHTFSMEVKQGDKWHLLGVNGAGKSTFLHAIKQIANQSKVDETQINDQLLNTNIVNIVSCGELNINARVYILDQHCSILKHCENMLMNLNYFCPGISESDARTLLANNGFRGDKVFQQVALLSGGEKMRLAMLIASHQTDCLLLLDEPDNHLDITSKDILSDALSRFEGSYILVSHDLDFVSRSGVNHRYEVT